MNSPSKPEITDTAYGYLVRWDEGIEILAEKIEERGGDLTSELTIRTTRPPAPGRLKWGRLNLMADGTRKQWANNLSDREPDLDWPAMLDQLAYDVSHRARLGEPAILLRDAPQPADDGYLIEPLVLGRLPTAFFGDGSSAKSLMALAAGISIHTGSPILGAVPSAIHRVAYLDFELDAWEHRKRMDAICRAFLIEPPDILYVPCRSALWDEVPRLKGLFAEHQIGFAIVDSVSYACGGLPLVSDEAANRFQEAMRKLAVGCICVAHRNKSEDGDKYIFGSIMWSNQMRSIWYVRKSQEEGDPVLALSFTHRKANTGILVRPLGFQVSFGDDIQIKRKDDLSLTAEGGSIHQRVRGVLRGGPLSIKELAGELGSSEAAVRKSIERDRDHGNDFSGIMVSGQRKIQLSPRIPELSSEDAN